MKAKPTILIIAMLAIVQLSFAQTVVCEGSSCTANDYNLDIFYLGDEFGNPFGPGYCEPGTTVNAHIWTNFSANSAANRYTLYLHFNLYIDGVFITTIDECYFEGQPIPTNVSLDLYTFNWECGSQIELNDFYMSWRPNAGQDCGCSNAKCFSDPSILVQAPLIANFEFGPSCESAYTVQFNSTTSGGSPPYSYIWDFGDGTTSTLESPLHTYTSTGPYTVTLTVLDTENTDSYEFEIVDFEPNLPPEIYAPTNLNIEGCDTSVIPGLPLSTTTIAISEAQFNAEGGTLVISNSITSLTYIDIVSGNCPTVVTRTYTVIDACDNTATDTQVLTINDTTLPTASNPNDILLQCILDLPPVDINVVTDEADNCATPTVTFISEVSNGNTCPEVITRTYRITDTCGNFIDVTQTIIINDTIAPTADTPPITNVQCISDVPTVDISIITNASDNCAVPNVTFISESTDSTSCPLTIIRLYSVVDDCGNETIISHNIIVNDNIAPTATAPADITVQCIGDVPAPDSNLITDESDNCSAPTVTFISDVSDNGTCPEIIIRTYSVIDDCNNELLLTQTITIQDDTLPTASAPPAITVECIGDVPAPDVSLISDASDNCSTPIVSFVSDQSTGQCPQIIIRTYRVTDACGNSIDLQQAINVIDTTNPTASNPAPINLNCDAAIPTPDPTVVTDAMDNCSNTIVSFVSDISNGLCPEVITRTYRITDECGNSTTVTQAIIFNDTEIPTIDVPLINITADCDAIPPPPSPTFTDNCTAVLDIDYIETNTNNNNTVDYIITRTWTVTDNCGNQDVFNQTVNVIITNCLVSQCNSCGIVDDTIPPTASNPVDTNIDCSENIPAPDPAIVIDEADNCVPPVVAFVSEVVNITCTAKVVRTYSVTDECGNVIYVTHTINVIDNILPTASNPIDINVSCNVDIPTPDINVVTDAADNCSNVTVSFVSDISNNACNERIVRTYRVEDTCGNFILVTQNINVIDNVAPTASAPANILLTCVNDIPIPDTSVITDEADNCSNITVQFISDVSDNLSCPETITRTYRVLDDCGNFTDINQLIIINDTILPTASAPATISVSCSSDVPMPNPNSITDEADNCSIPTVTHISDTSDGLSCPETITRIYRITDACGNSIDVSQTILINDTILPTASNPATITIDDATAIPAVDVTVVTDEADNCSIPTVTFINEVTDGNTCPETITRTFRVTDACGNFIDVFQNIIIQDSTSPTSDAPTPLSLSCEEPIPAPDTSIITNVSDNNGNTTVTFISESSNGETCPEIITRIYRITDDCGNFIEVSHFIIIDDEVLPTASNPADLTFNDYSLVPAPDTTVVIDEADNCGIPTVTFISEISNNDTCEEILTRTYQVTDNCGNAINVTQNITIIDDTNPTATAPADLLLSCEAAIPAPDTSIITGVSDDNSIPTVNFISEVSDNLSCPETITRIYRVTDACGNFIDVEHLIIINDIIPPTASNPATVTLDANDPIPTPNIEDVIDEADNCGIPTVAFVSDVSDGLSCPETVTRTYSVTDACGNAIQVEQLIIIGESNAPTASNPIAITIDCIDNVPGPDPSVVTDAIDDTSSPIITFVSDVSDGNTCPETITRTYNVSDACGNSINVTQQIIINDDISPTASNPPNLTLQCALEVPSPDTSIITDATDNCGTVTIAFVSDNTINNGCADLITRIYSLTDTCGNTSTIEQLITIEDTIAPTLLTSIVPELDVYCDTPPEIPTIEFQDNCSTSVNVNYSESIISQTGSSYDIIRTWTATDDCSNTIETIQTVHVIVDNQISDTAIELCISDDIIDVNNFIDPNTNGAWYSDDLSILDGTLIDPARTPLGDYVLTYSYVTGTCKNIFELFVNINENCIEYPCVRSQQDVTVTKMITPNGDNMNDYLEVVYNINEQGDNRNSCNIKTILKIFNRWGTKVYQSNDYKNDWGGEQPAGGLGNAAKLPNGSYYYIIELTNSGLESMQGYIYLGTQR
jgi:gliding motility-associated-like protein